MAVRLYLTVEGVLLHRRDRARRQRRGFEAAPHVLDFLTWAVYGFECYWLTSLDRSGSDTRIKRASRVALNLPNLPGELELLFFAVQPTAWENSKLEAIDLDSDFRWIENDLDQESLAGLDRRGLKDRLILCSTDQNPDDLARVRCRLEPLFE